MATPELYQTKSFDKDAILKEKYGTDPSRRDIRRFNRYWKSDQKDQDEVAFLQAEHDKQMASWKSATDAAIANTRASGEALTKKWAEEKAAEEARRAAEAAAKAAAAPKVSVTNADYWNRVAKRYGFDDYNAVAAWQKENGLTVDGKFGSKSYDKWAQLNPGKVGSVPVIKPTVRPRTAPAASQQGPIDETSQDFVGPVPRTSDTQTETKAAIPTIEDMWESTYFREPHVNGWKYRTVDGKRYPVVVTTGLYNNAVGLENDHSYAYDPATGMIRKLDENFAGNPGEPIGDWMKIPEFKKNGGTMKKINYFGGGGPARFGFQSDTLSVGPNRKIISQSFYPLDANGRPVGDWEHVGGRVKSVGPDGERIEYFDEPADYIDSDGGFMPVGYANDQDAAKARFMERLRAMGSSNPDAQKVQAEMKGKYQQGGAVAPQQDMQQQVVALVQAAMQGDQKATETVNKIIEAAKAGDQQAMQIAQMIQQVAQQMQGQATAAKWGSKLNYIRSLKFAKGGKACPACEKGAPIVEKKACGGKKAKKRYFGGLI